MFQYNIKIKRIKRPWTFHFERWKIRVDYRLSMNKKLGLWTQTLSDIKTMNTRVNKP